MTSENPLRPWDIVVVRVPYSERLAEKRRPAVIVSNSKLHREGYVWIAMITGAGKPRKLGDVVISDLDHAGLPGASMVRASKVATVEPDRVLRKIGSLAPSERASIRTAFAGFLAP